MTKVKSFIGLAIVTFLLVAISTFLFINSFSTPLLAEDCSAGGCDCECIGGCSAFFGKIPFMPVVVFGCECADGSESCQGAYF